MADMGFWYRLHSDLKYCSSWIALDAGTVLAALCCKTCWQLHPVPEKNRLLVAGIITAAVGSGYRCNRRNGSAGRR